MTKHVKFLKHLMSSQSDTDIAFDDLCSLLKRLGFQARVRGDHYIFTKDGIVEIIIPSTCQRQGQTLPGQASQKPAPRLPAG